VLVRGVADSTPAAQAGLERGDLLVAAAGKPIENLDGLFEVLDGLSEGDRLELTVVRGTEERKVEVALDKS
jgi:S1-C subfamily serine protease